MRRRDRQAIAQTFVGGANIAALEIRYRRVLVHEEQRRTGAHVLSAEYRRLIVEECIREFLESASRVWGRK